MSAKNLKKVYSGKAYSNPYFRDKARSGSRVKRSRISRPKINWRNVLIALVFLSAFIGSSWLVFGSGYLDIKQIEVRGLREGSKIEVEILANNQEKLRRLAIFSQKNLFFFDTGELDAKIKEAYNFEKLEISKDFPDKVLIQAVERQASAIWGELDKYYQIDNVGNVITEYDLAADASNTLPVIDNRGDPRINERRLDGQQPSIQLVLKLASEYRDSDRFKIDRYIVDNEINTVKADLKDGPEIYFNPSVELSEQISRLNILIQEKLKDDFRNKSYIDLRFGEVINYQ